MSQVEPGFTRLPLGAVLAIGILLLIAMSGCASTAPENRSTTTASGSGTPPTNWPHVDGLNATVSLSACEVRWNIIDWPAEAMNPRVPEGVRPLRTGAALLRGGFNVMTCSEASFNHTVARPFQLAWLEVIIDKPPGAQSNATYHYWLLEAFSNTPAFAKTAAHFGLHIEVASNISIVDSAPVQNRYPFEISVPSSSPQYFLRGYRYGMGADYERNTGYYFGESTATMASMTLTGKGKLTGAGQGDVEFGAGSYWAEQSTTPAWAIQVNHIHQFNGFLEFADP